MPPTRCWHSRTWTCPAQLDLPLPTRYSTHSSRRLVTTTPERWTIQSRKPCLTIGNHATRNRLCGNSLCHESPVHARHSIAVPVAGQCSSSLQNVIFSVSPPSTKFHRTCEFGKRWYSSAKAVSNDGNLRECKRISRRAGGEKRHYRFFTPHEDETMLWMINEGYRWKAIAVALDRTVSAVWARYQNHLAHVHVVPAPPTAPTTTTPNVLYSAEEDRMIVQLLNSGMHFHGIARRIGRSVQGVRDRHTVFLAEGAVGKTYYQRKARRTDSLGRQKNDRYTMREQLIIAYFRSKLRMQWSEMVQHFPDRNLVSLRAIWSKRVKRRFDGLVTEDPRGWDYETVVQVFAQGLAQAEATSKPSDDHGEHQ